MATTVLLEVTPRPTVEDPDSSGPLDAELAQALRGAGVELGHGWVKRGSGPWRRRWQLSGADRIATGRRLGAALRSRGYDAELFIWR